MPRKSRKQQPVEPQPATLEEALVYFWNEQMIQWRRGSEQAAFAMSGGAGPEIRRAYQVVYGDNVVPIFAAMGPKPQGRSVA